jgi:hypothetical protein
MTGNPPPDPDNPSGVPQLDSYLRTRMTRDEREQLAQTYQDGDPEGGQALVNQANIRNGNGKKR